jgi:radical SAM/Cys-rich protein
LNEAGYAMPGSGLNLHLVHNPAGAFLPGPQAALEAEYRRVLRDEHGAAFNTLFCLINSPVGRYRDFLKRSGNLADYMRTLQCAFNTHTVSSVMCRATVSVGWDGRLYDCDFNQMLDLTVSSGAPVHIRDFDYDRLAAREIVVRNHCFACTAGAGSSCQGALAE